MIIHEADAVERHSLRASEETEAAHRGKKTHDLRTPFPSIRKAGGHPNYCCRRIAPKRTILIESIIIIILLLLFLPLIIVLAVWRGGESNQTCPDANNSAVLGPACPDGWVGYERKCYFFSEEERNWTSAQSFCISQGSSLAAIQSELERVFMLRFKGEADHWIGLRKDFNDTWIWADGSEYSNTLVVKGSENCTSLSKEFVIASRCHIPTKWICNHPDAYVRNKNSTAGKVICQEEL
ncbi:C-type lectin domain family 2 member D-like [Lacerta agilis]|uniref:C-type lectin domain family 2 member D-like n=1 Tax=Lacerta agilis TaxID=80427 RepID=UPI0014197AE5|nr:C-type lectin domain family 2 member D-like [Lacerta agilis]XP_032997470.1 C-type lectin domain family 2 member D-like [Lacerta agilis]